MVLEGLIKPLAAEKRPFELFFLGILFSSIAIVVSTSVFAPYSSIVAITLSALVCIPVIYGVMRIEEKKTVAIAKESVLFKEHGKALLFFLFLFLGFVISFALWYYMLPEPQVTQLFSVQTDTIAGAWDAVTGNVTNSLGDVFELLGHNIRVLVFCLVFAFLFGFGAIFILTWNASVIGAAIGDTIRSHTGSFASAITAGLARYLIHGIPEIVAYFSAGLAGGIISIAVINHDLQSRRFKHIIFDSAGLVLLSGGLLVVAAFLEVYVSPLV